MEFLTIYQDIMLPFIPRLILAVLPNLAHHVPMIQTAANRTNRLLLNVIQSLPPPSEPSSRQNSEKFTLPPSTVVPGSPTPVPTGTASTTTSRPTTASREPTVTAKDAQPEFSSPDLTPVPGTPFLQSQRARASVAVDPVKITTAIAAVEPGAVHPSRPESPMSTISVPQVQSSPEESMLQERDPFDYQATVNALTIQFLSEHEETRVAALKWLIMLHQKAPRKVGLGIKTTIRIGLIVLCRFLPWMTELSPLCSRLCQIPRRRCYLFLFPASFVYLTFCYLFQVIKHDLQLLAQISSSSEESYFKLFMHTLLELFSTDRKLLETRGSLIIRQLCLNLNTERIYRTFAEILEKEEVAILEHHLRSPQLTDLQDLEFASGMVQKLNMILITSPELADFRRRLKSLETRVRYTACLLSLSRC